MSSSSSDIHLYSIYEYLYSFVSFPWTYLRTTLYKRRKRTRIVNLVSLDHLHVPNYLVNNPVLRGRCSNRCAILVSTIQFQYPKLNVTLCLL